MLKSFISLKLFWWFLSRSQSGRWGWRQKWDHGESAAIMWKREDERKQHVKH